MLAKRSSQIMHASLDGFVAGPNGEMDWINVEGEIFDFAANRTEEADTALYGRITYKMMDAYWPTAAQQPNATKHDIEHSNWYNRVAKIVLSRTMKGKEIPNSKIISDNLSAHIQELKKQNGKNILMFGSPSAAHSLMRLDLIDDYWVFVNQVLLGTGIPLFKGIEKKQNLKLASSHEFSSGVVCLHYERSFDKP